MDEIVIASIQCECQPDCNVAHTITVTPEEALWLCDEILAQIKALQTVLEVN